MFYLKIIKIDRLCVFFVRLEKNKKQENLLRNFKVITRMEVLKLSQKMLLSLKLMKAIIILLKLKKKSNRKILLIIKRH